MKNLVILLLSVILFSSCDNITGSGNIVTENRHTESFTGVTVGGGFDVEIKKGSTAGLIVEADDNLIKNIETDVRNGVLHINISRHSLTNAHLKIYITAPSINSINASAGAEVDVKDGLADASEINVEASSGAKITSAVDAPSVSTNTSSAGEVNLKGRTKNFNAESSSGASVNASDLLTENTVVNVSSGANAHVQSSVSLDATASSGGNIGYKGGGNVKVNTSSGGGVNKE